MGNGALRVGLAGVGGRGAAIRRSLLRSGGLSLECIYDVDEKAVSRALEDGSFAVCDSFEQMLEAEIDAVVVTVPNHLHEAFAVQAASAGKHVFIEKPIANRLDEAERMIDACRSAGVLLAVGHSARYGARSRAMGALVDEGVLGDICGFQVCASHDNAKRSSKTWKTDPELTPCVPLMQLGIHAIDTLRGYFGDVAAVFSHHASIHQRFEMTDTTHSIIRFENGVVGSLSCFYMVPKTGVWNLYGTEARAISRGDMIEVLEEGDEEPAALSLSEAGDVPGDVQMLEAFASAVLNGEPFPTDGVTATKALAVVWAAIYSSEKGREVSIEEALDHYGAEYLKG